MFNSMRIRHVTTFFNYKSLLMTYIRFLIANDALPSEQEDVLASVTVDELKINEANGVQYYKNLNTLFEAIKDSISVSECYDPTLYDLSAVILFLAWYGLDEEEIIDYRKEFVLDDGLIIRGSKSKFHLMFCSSLLGYVMRMGITSRREELSFTPTLILRTSFARSGMPRSPLLC